MTPLAAKLVFFGSSALGALALGTTAYLVKNPEAFAPTIAFAVPESVNVLPPRPLAPPPAVVAEPIVLEPITVTGSKAPLIPPHAAPAKPAEPKEVVPCSDWEEMGPTNVEDGKSVGGVRRVRKLC